MIVFIFLLFYISAVQAQSLSRYEIIVDHLEVSKDGKLIDIGTVRVKKYNRTTFVITGYCDSLIPFSDDITGHFDFYSYQGNEYRRLYEKQISKMCTFLREDKIYVPKLITKTSLAPEIKSCPTAPRRIHFYDLTVPGDFLPFTPPKGEKFRLDMKYFLDGAKVENISAYILLKKIVDDNKMPTGLKLG